MAEREESRMKEGITTGRSRLSIWVQAVRPFAFTASVMPVVVGALYAVSFAGPVRWGLLPLAGFALVLFHSGTNLVSDAADFLKGVDREGTFGGSGVLVAGLLTPGEIWTAGVLAFVAGSLLGLVLVAVCGLPVLALGLAGLLGGFFYGGSRFGYKYHGLGDAMVFILLGPLPVIGTYFVLTGTFTMNVLYVSLPVGCLVTAILHANNLRDIINDRRARVRTLANVLGPTGAKVEYFLLVGLAYAAVAVMVMGGAIGPWTLLVGLSLPAAIRDLRMVAAVRPDRASESVFVDVETAKLHFLFAALLSFGLLLSAAM
jgi:1,4-dihydroxy-2-naphthoate octaprenyltransferase